MRILTFNLRHNNDYWELRKPLCINLIEKYQPDVIGFQEVWMPIQQADLILQDVYGAPYHLYVSPKQAHHGTEGIAIASRYPARGFQTLDLPGGERVAQCVTLSVDGRDVVFANTHLHHLPIDNERERLPQMQAILDWLSPMNEPTILTGDMNATPDSSTVQLAKQQLDSAYAQAHGGQEPTFTFPAPLAEDGYDRAPVMIDYVMITPSTLQATSGVVIGGEAHGTNPKLSASDHLAVLVEVDFRS